MVELLTGMPKEATEVRVWSDEPARQFKNKYVMSVIQSLSERHGETIFWDFSTTSHGKGPVEGIGAAIKEHIEDKKNFTAGANLYECIIRLNALESENVRQL